MKLLLDYFPLAVFVGIYFWSGVEEPMYPAVQGLIVASVIQTVGVRLITGKFEQLHLWILGITIVLGGMTLAFRDPVFVQWKASGVAWLTALVLLYSQLIAKKPLIQKLMSSAFEDENIEVPEKAWSQINYSWPIGYTLFGFLNLYVAFNYSEAFWVKFKLFGLMGMTLLLIGFTIYTLSPYLMEAEESEQTEESQESQPDSNRESPVSKLANENANNKEA